jgi:hypothetical protein
LPHYGAHVLLRYAGLCAVILVVTEMLLKAFNFVYAALQKQYTETKSGHSSMACYGRSKMAVYVQTLRSFSNYTNLSHLEHRPI